MIYGLLEDDEGKLTLLLWIWIAIPHNYVAEIKDYGEQISVVTRQKQIYIYGIFTIDNLDMSIYKEQQRRFINLTWAKTESGGGGRVGF